LIGFIRFNIVLIETASHFVFEAVLFFAFLPLCAVLF